MGRDRRGHPVHRHDRLFRRLPDRRTSRSWSPRPSSRPSPPLDDASRTGRRTGWRTRGSPSRWTSRPRRPRRRRTRARAAAGVGGPVHCSGALAQRHYFTTRRPDNGTPGSDVAPDSQVGPRLRHDAGHERYISTADSATCGRATVDNAGPALPGRGLGRDHRRNRLHRRDCPVRRLHALVLPLVGRAATRCEGA